MSTPPAAVRLPPRAARRLVERGASEPEVMATAAEGERFAAKFGRSGLRRNFLFRGRIIPQRGGLETRVPLAA